MPEFRVLNFEKGRTDNYVNGPKNAGQKFENLIISRNRKPVSRDGSELFDSDLSQIPTGTQRVQHLNNHEDFLFEFSGDEIFYRDTTFKELVGPVDSHDAFGDLGSPSTSHNATAPWQKHLYASIDTYSRPRKIYNDESGAWQIRNAGLPSPGDVRGFSTAAVLANALKSTYNAHVADVAEHIATDTAVSAANASDVDTLVTLTNEIKSRYVAHEADARLGSPAKHQAQTSDDDSLDEEEDIVTLDQAINLLNNIKAKYNLHDADTTAHSTGSLHQESTADATREFTITPETNDGASYIYAVLYKFVYKVGTVTYVDRSKPTEVAETNGGDFSTAIKGNDLSNLPALTNTIFGTKEAWDTVTIVKEIYRTTNGGVVLRKVAEIANSATTYEDDTTDANLTGIKIYTDGGTLANGEPPLCKYLVQSNDIMWYANVKEDSEEKPFRLRHSLQLDPDSSPSSFTVDLDDTITGIGAIGINPIVFTEGMTYRLEGLVDSLGRGFVKKRVVDSSVGCVSHNSIVAVKNGLYFAALDGFYFTNGFKNTKISNHLNTSYSGIVSSDTTKGRIYGVQDPETERIFWAVQEDSTATENDSVWVHDPFWGLPNGEGTFTSWVYGSNGNPTALEVIGGDLIRSDSRGYTFRHLTTLFTDPVVDTAVTPSTWQTTTVIYDYISTAHAFGTELGRKWVTRLLTVLKAVTNISLQPKSINDDGGAGRLLKEIRSSALFTWGDPEFTWGDPEFIWNAPATVTGIRRFPRDGIRCTLKQVEYTNSRTIIINSDSLGSITVDATAKTLTLVSGEWPVDVINYVIIIGTSTVEFPITARTSTVLTVTDTSSQLSDGTETTWIMKGFRKDERFHLEGYTIEYSPFGTSHTAYRTGDDGGNA